MKVEYCVHMDQIFDLYSKMVHDLTEYLKRNTPIPKLNKTRPGAALLKLRLVTP